MNDMELKVRKELKERKRKEAENSELKYKLEAKDEEMELKNEEHNRYISYYIILWFINVITNYFDIV